MSQRPAGSPHKPVFIYDTRGDWHATRIGDFIYSTRGEYVAYVENGEVYKSDGEWIGHLSRDGRILRKRSEHRRELHPNPPLKPPKPEKLPPRAPLPPMMAELDFSTMDVLDEDPEIFKRISDLRPDMD
jgi:hypothetical protein